MADYQMTLSFGSSVIHIPVSYTHLAQWVRCFFIPISGDKAPGRAFFHIPGLPVPAKQAKAKRCLLYTSPA